MSIYFIAEVVFNEIRKIFLNYYCKYAMFAA